MTQQQKTSKIVEPVYLNLRKPTSTVENLIGKKLEADIKNNEDKMIKIITSCIEKWKSEEFKVHIYLQLYNAW